MYADSISEPNKGRKVEAKGDSAPVASLFDESVDLGEGLSPDARARKLEAELMAITGPRLRRARKLAHYSESAAGIAMSHKGVSQISQFENGHRAPSLHNLTVLARFYGTTTDYLLGMHDDITLSSPEEGNQALLVGVMAEAMSSQFHDMVNAMSKRSGIMLEGYSVDRVLLGKVAEKVQELAQAVEVVARQPEFQDVRNGAKVIRLVTELRDSMKGHIKRVERERMALNEVEKPEVEPQVIKQNIQRMLFEV
jgi:transcriptional regulator with XRE-family HTH domain